VRSYAPGFIFTTALPPLICSAATAAIRHLKSSHWERDYHQDRAARLKSMLEAARLPVMPTETHIVPLHVGDAEKCKLNAPTIPGIRIPPSFWALSEKQKKEIRPRACLRWKK